MNWLKYLVGLAAIVIAASAAYFSVSGLSKLFAGGAMAIIVMASALEFAKLIAATYLKQRWNVITGFSKLYLSLAVAILMLITSAGIYGFLTSAYQTTFDNLAIVEQKIKITSLKKDRYQTELTSYISERDAMSASITELTRGLSNNVIQYTDTSGNIVKTTSSATRRALESQLNDTKAQRDIVASKIDVLNDSITNLDIKILDINTNNDLAAEMGPLRYLSKLTNTPMDTVVNWFTLCIVIVFDPLAIALIIAFNGLVLEEKTKLSNTSTPPADKKLYEVYGENTNSTNTDGFKHINTEFDRPKVDKSVDDSLNNTIANLQFVNNTAPITTIPNTMGFNERLSSQNSDSISEPNNVLTTTTESKINEISDDTAKLDIPTKVVVAPTKPKHHEPAAELRTPSTPRHTEPVAELRTPAAVVEPILNNERIRSNGLTDYKNPNFDWNNKSAWVNHPAAVKYWIQNIRSAEEASDDTIKIY